MALQKGQVVLLDRPSTGSSPSRPAGVLLDRDVASGRYRARLCEKPWRCVKVTRAGIHSLRTSDGGGGSCQGADAAQSFVDKPPAKCNYSLGVLKEARLRALPVSLKGAVTSLPPSPVRHGQMWDDRPSCIKGELYHSIEEAVPHAPAHRNEVHRRRCYIYTNVQDSQLMDFAFLPARGSSVKRHRLLAPMSSEALRALVEEDHKIRKGEHVRSHEATDIASINRNEDLQVNDARMARAAFEKAEFIARQQVLQEMEVVAEAKPPGESEEQRILREFMEYELESPSNAHPEVSTPKKDSEEDRDSCVDKGLDNEEEFEIDSNDAAAQPSLIAAEPSILMVRLSDPGQPVGWDEDFEEDPSDASAQPRLAAPEPSILMVELCDPSQRDEALDDVEELD